MNLLLYANYILNAEVLQTEPSNRKKTFNKLLWNIEAIDHVYAYYFNYGCGE